MHRPAIYRTIRTPGGPSGLPSGGNGEGWLIRGAPGGPSGLPSAIRVAGREIVVRSSATASQRKFIFTGVDSFPRWKYSVIMYEGSLF
jgi:hypothetical protein